MTTATTTRRRRCSECGELKPDVDGRQRLCADCEDGKSYCQICDEWKDRAWGGGCRHVGWSDEHGCECGCGTSDIEPKDHRESFEALLAKFAGMTFYDYKRSATLPLLPELRRLIAKNNFWTYWHGPMIGGPPDLGLRTRVRKDYCPIWCDISSSEQEAWGDEAIEAMQLGMAWLCSLDSKTKAANKLTVQWIDEFLERQAT